MTKLKETLRAKQLHIDSSKIVIIYIREDSMLCKTEGFKALDRIRITTEDDRFIIGTLNTTSNQLLQEGEVGLCDYAWKLLKLKDGDVLKLRYPDHLESLSYIRGKIYGKKLTEEQLRTIVKDITAGRLSDVHMSAFLTACAGHRLELDELVALTDAMVNVGDRIIWPSKLVVDKHCVGGLPGNRTTPIVVAIIAAFGLTIPKTSSRAITSPAGTADTIETLMPVDLTFEQMQDIARREHGCLAWGGSVSLSPADDVLIRIERALDLDSQSQLAASILSKKIAAGSTHVLIDIPIGETAKVRDEEQGETLKNLLESIGKELGLTVKTIFSDGSEPVGRGIGPALEARDIVAVLQNKEDAPQDLRDRSLTLAAQVLEFSPDISEGEGQKIAEEILKSGKAWKKFQAIAKAQGGLRTPPVAPYTHQHVADKPCKITCIDNRRISRLAKLAGAPFAPAAGVDLHFKCNEPIGTGETIITIHAQTEGELEYAKNFLNDNLSMFTIEDV